jgi:hypothetical protein
MNRFFQHLLKWAIAWFDLLMRDKKLGAIIGNNPVQLARPTVVTPLPVREIICAPNSSRKSRLRQRDLVAVDSRSVSIMG